LKDESEGQETAASVLHFRLSRFVERAARRLQLNEAGMIFQPLDASVSRRVGENSQKPNSFLGEITHDGTKADHD
jgi:hypothetical protein